MNHFFTALGAFFLGLGQNTLQFLVGTAKALEANPQIQAIATQEVQAAETAIIAGVEAGNAATGAQKFAVAQAGVVAQLEAAGVPVVMNQVHLAIEGAVANLPAKVPAAQPAADQAAQS